MTMIKQFEEWIRAGEFAKVAKALRELNPKKIPRGELAAFANLANRADQPRWAFRLLNPIVRSDKPAIASPSEAERIEYAESLQRMGLLDEALGIFKELDPQRFPVVRLRVAFCLFRKWQYADAVHHLRTLVSSLGDTEYLRTVAQVNLAAALVYLREDTEALRLLEELCSNTRARGQTLLLGNCLELIAQVLIRQKEWAVADRMLGEADAIFVNDKNKYSLFVQKWRSIAWSLRDNRVHAELLNCRAEAARQGEWETQRDCDLYIGLVRGDQDLLRKVYFGTPHASFRRNMEALAGGILDLPANYIWNIAGTAPVTEVFNLLSGTGSGMALETGRLMHRFLILLCQDFYSPVTIGAAFSSLYPGEHFAQEGSASRVIQLAMRLRTWMAEESAGLSIAGSDGSYRLEAKEGMGIQVPRDMPGADSYSITWQQIQTKLAHEEFSRQQLTILADCSPASAKRLLRWAVNNGKAKMRGSGAHVKYKVS